MGFFADIAQGLGQSTLNRQQTELLRFLEEERFKRQQEAQIASEERQSVRENERFDKSQGAAQEQQSVQNFLGFLESDPLLAKKTLESDPDLSESLSKFGVDSGAVQSRIQSKIQTNEVLAQIQDVSTRIMAGVPVPEEAIVAIDTAIESAPKEIRPELQAAKTQITTAGEVRFNQEMEQIEKVFNDAPFTDPVSARKTLDSMNVSARAKTTWMGILESNRSSNDYDIRRRLQLQKDAESPVRRARERESFLNNPAIDPGSLVEHQGQEALELISERDRIWRQAHPELNQQVAGLWAEAQVQLSQSAEEPSRAPLGVDAETWIRIEEKFHNKDEIGGPRLAEELFKRAAYLSLNEKDYTDRATHFQFIPYNTETSAVPVEIRQGDYANEPVFAMDQKLQGIRELGVVSNPATAPGGVFGLVTKGKPPTREARLAELGKAVSVAELTLETMGARAVPGGSVLYALNPSQVDDIIEKYRNDLDAAEEFAREQIEIRFD